VSSTVTERELPANRPKHADVAARRGNVPPCKPVPGACQDEGLSAVV
jgi:hypothetical protein